MKIKRFENAKRNIYWGFIERIITLILAFVTRTVFIRVLGAEYLGLNTLFTSLLMILNVSELGLGSAIIYSMYKPIAEDDKELTSALLNFYRKIYFYIGSFILLVGLTLIPFLPRLISGAYPAGINLTVLYLLFLFNTVVSYFLFAYKAALFSAYHRTDLISKRTSIVTILGNLLRITVLLLFRNYYVFAIIIPIETIVTNMINAYLAKKIYPEVTCTGSITAEMKTAIKKRVIGLMSFRIYGVVFSSFDTIIISLFLGLVPLALFSNYYFIQQSIVGFMAIFTLSITAGIGNKMVTNSREDNYQDFKNIVFMNGWLSSFAAICLLNLYQHFIGLWLGKDYLLPFSTTILLVMYFFIPRVTTITYTYRTAAGLWWEDKFRPIVAMVVNLILSIILIQRLGINGVIIATLVCSLLINIPWGTIVLFKNYFKRSPKEYFMKLSHYTVTTIIAGVATLFINSFLPTTGLFSFLLKMIICAIVPNVILTISYYKKEEFYYLKQYLFKFINTRLIKRKCTDNIKSRNDLE